MKNQVPLTALVHKVKNCGPLTNLVKNQAPLSVVECGTYASYIIYTYTMDLAVKDLDRQTHYKGEKVRECALYCICTQ